MFNRRGFFGILSAAFLPKSKFVLNPGDRIDVSSISCTANLLGKAAAYNADKRIMETFVAYNDTEEIRITRKL